MKTIKVSEATNDQLNWLVGTALGLDVWVATNNVYPNIVRTRTPPRGGADCNYDPSGNWAQGGPIIEREKIELRHANTGMFASYLGGPTWFGPTPLIAAMRCYVASKLGDIVQVPKELT